MTKPCLCNGAITHVDGACPAVNTFNSPITTVPPFINVSALIAERDRLSARLAEVERERDEQTAICTEAIAQVNALKAEVAELRQQLATAEAERDLNIKRVVSLIAERAAAKSKEQG